MQAFMKSSLDYIEQNLKTDITAEELAGMAGYSIWHYYRLFNEATGSSVLGYILKRRLDHALAEISEGRKAIDAVFEYGFDTYAGFYKAFVKMYGVSPKKYLSIYGEHKPRKMGGFYMINRKEFTEGELRRILENWDIPQDLPLKKRSVRCSDGTTLTEREWKVGDNYVLTMEERSRMIKHLRIQKALAAQSFTGATQIKMKSGEECLGEADMFILTHRATGEPLIRQIDKFEGKYREFGFKYGVAIAKIHRVLAEVETDIMPDEWGIFMGNISNVRKKNEQFDIGLTEEFFADYANSIKKLNELFDKLPKQLLCWNAHPCNILFENGEVSGFEFLPGGSVARSSRMYDLCKCADDILGELSGWWNRTALYAGDDIHDKWLEILAGMLQGYDTENKLTTEEKQAVYYLMCCVKTYEMTTCWDGMGYKGWFKTNCENLKYMTANKEKFDNIF